MLFDGISLTTRKTAPSLTTFDKRIELINISNNTATLYYFKIISTVNLVISNLSCNFVVDILEE